MGLFSKKKKKETTEVKKDCRHIEPGDIVYEHEYATQFPNYVLDVKDNKYFTVLRFFDTGRGDVHMQEKKTLCRLSSTEIVKMDGILADTTMKKIVHLIEYYEKTGHFSSVSYDELVKWENKEQQKKELADKYQVIIDYHSKNRFGSVPVDIKTAKAWEKKVKDQIGREKTIEIVQDKNGLSSHLSLDNISEVGLNRADEFISSFYWKLPGETPKAKKAKKNAR